jgi:hypothetical protein
MRLTAAIFPLSLLAYAGDGLPPRASASDYPVRQATTDATIAAVRVPANQAVKMFSPDIARQYIVLEVAIYPRDGRAFDVDWFDFSLKIGDAVSHVEKPRDVATPWPEKTSTPGNGVDVITETGVVIAHTSDPVYGSHTGVGTWQSVGATNDPRAAPPPPPPGPDPQIVEQRVRERSLPEGATRRAIAGYLFFPVYNVKRSKAPIEMRWSRDNDSAVLTLPK